MSDHETDVYAAVPVVRRTYRELVDGTLAVTIHVAPMWKKTFLQLFPDIDADGALAPLTREAAQSLYGPDAQAKPAYSAEAEALYRSSFFRTPDVWRAVGTDQQFRQWVAQQECVIGAQAAPSGALSGIRVKGISVKGIRVKGMQCDGGVVAAHVRRIADGAGTGIKPEYSCIPLCDTHHQLQHNQGESAIGPKDYVDRLRLRYVHTWCWQMLKQQMGYESWAQVPPKELYDWAVAHDLEKHLPEQYQCPEQKTN